MAQELPAKKTRRTTNYKNADTKNTSGIVPKTDAQKRLIEAIGASSQVIVLGFAGTGKTYVTATMGKDIGILPGDLGEKVAPWALPVLDVLQKHWGKGVLDTAIKNGNVEMAPLAMMRGRSFENAFVIADEAQNITTAELKMLLTRIGEGSTIVLNGDVMQSDLKGDSGLSKIAHLAKKHMLPVPIIEFGLEDIVRSDICKQWVKVFYEESL